MKPILACARLMCRVVARRHEQRCCRRLMTKVLLQRPTVESGEFRCERWPTTDANPLYCLNAKAETVRQAGR